MITVAIRTGSRTNRLIRKNRRFSINWIDFEPERSRRTILELASPSEKELSYDKLREHKIPYFIFQKVPVLEYASAFAICKVKKRLRTGDHDLFLADVVYAKALRDFTLDGYWRFKEYKPILYVGSIRRDPLITI